MAEVDWRRWESVATDGLAPLDFLVGAWSGVGQSHGAAVQARMEARRVLGGTFLEVSEQLFAADGAPAHEDRAWYRFDPEEQRLRVHHFMHPAWVTERVVGLLPGGGCCWDAGPFAPRVELRPAPEGLRSEVWLPFEPAPAVSLLYRRS
jgi:hypothetical protein